MIHTNAARTCAETDDDNRTVVEESARKGNMNSETACEQVDDTEHSEQWGVENREKGGNDWEERKRS